MMKRVELGDFKRALSCKVMESDPSDGSMRVMLKGTDAHKTAHHGLNADLQVFLNGEWVTLGSAADIEIKIPQDSIIRARVDFVLQSIVAEADDPEEGD